MGADLQKQVELVVTSPLKRTLQTTLRGWRASIDNTGGFSKVVCLPQLQECNAYPCDTGSAKEVLEKDTEVNMLDFTNLTPDWTSKQGFYAADEKTLNERARWVRQWVYERPEKTILLVGHGDIIRRITGAPEANSTYAWRNAEVKTYKFRDGAEADKGYWLTPEGVDVAAGGYEPTSSEMDEVEKAEKARG